MAHQIQKSNLTPLGSENKALHAADNGNGIIAHSQPSNNKQNREWTMHLPVGDLVEVAKEHRTDRKDSDGGRAFIQSVSSPDRRGNKTYGVKCVVGNCFSPNVKQGRLSPVPIDAVARRRSGETTTRPSSLSCHHAPTNKRTLPTGNNSSSKRQKTIQNTAWLLNLCKLTKSNGTNAGLTTIKKFKKDKPKGWLRSVHSISDKTQLTKDEKSLCMVLFFALRSLEDTAGALVAHAWGVTRQSVHNWEKQGKKQDMNFTRKVRSDKGETAFTSETRRNATFTPVHSFNKMLRAENRGEPLSKSDMKIAWKNASEETKQAAIQQSELFLRQSPFLLSEVHGILKQTNGSVTWQEIATQISSNNTQIVHATTICRFIMSLPMSSCKTTRIHPHLSKHHKQNRYRWSIEFWIFWESAKACHRIQIALAHQDEKWFFGIVIRKHNKSVPFLGTQPASHSVHHKSHINKTMAIAPTAFAPFENDMTKGGRAFKISLDRVGGHEISDETTHKREYKSDGTFHCPKRDDNISRKEGERCWVPMEIAGSNEGTDKKPKFSLLKWFLEVEIPRLEAIARQVSTITGKTSIIRHQMDGAGPHRCNILLERLRHEFDVRGWVFKFQPSQSPLTNVKDFCIFPAMSKAVTAEQGLSFGSHVVETETLWETVTKCWDKFPESTIARAYAGHHQVVNAIYSCKGGDEFARGNGIHCNVRKHCAPHFESESATRPAGVEMLETLEREGVESLKHPKPDELDEFGFDALNEQELRCLAEHLPADHDDWLDVNNALAAIQLDED